ncbi:hypothetical protein NEAUS06_1320 [Nematocida ausubeli]|nr:hypothetical protein NEAUS06_1320 [Nematocida ausubeli]
MKLYVLLYMTAPLFCWCNTGKKETNQLMITRLAQIDSMLRNILDGKVSPQKSFLSSTLKGLSSKSSKSRSTSKKARSKQKNTDSESDYAITKDIQIRERKEAPRLYSRDDEDSFEKPRRKKRTRTYSADDEESSAYWRPSKGSRANSSFEESADRDYDVSSVNRRAAKPGGYAYDDEYSQEER